LESAKADVAPLRVVEAKLVEGGSHPGFPGPTRFPDQGDTPDATISGAALGKYARLDNVTPDLKDLISRIRNIAGAGDEERAMALAADLVAQYPSDSRVWSLRSYLRGRVSDYTGAVADVTHAIELDPLETSYLLSRGMDRLRLGDYLLAAEDFSRGLDLCDHHHDNYFREMLYFMRAEAFLMIGKKDQALTDLTHVRSDFRTWTYRLRTKADLIADAGRLTGNPPVGGRAKACGPRSHPKRTTARLRKRGGEGGGNRGKGRQ
jgi:tetratricopeptide (TPR) repeat protein